MEEKKNKFRVVYIFKESQNSKIRAFKAMAFQPTKEIMKPFSLRSLSYIKKIKICTINLNLGKENGNQTARLRKLFPQRLMKYLNHLEVILEKAETFKISLRDFSRLENISIKCWPQLTVKAFNQFFKSAIISSKNLRIARTIPFDKAFLNLFKLHPKLEFVEVYQNATDPLTIDLEALGTIVRFHENRVKYKLSLTGNFVNPFKNKLPETLEALKVASVSTIVKKSLEDLTYQLNLKVLRFIITSNNDLTIDFASVGKFKNLEHLSVQTNVRYSHLLVLPAFSGLKIPSPLKSLILEVYLPLGFDLSPFKKSLFTESLSELKFFEELVLRAEVQKTLFNPDDENSGLQVIETFLENINSELKNLTFIDTSIQFVKKNEQSHKGSDSTSLMRLISKFDKMKRLSLRTDYKTSTNEIFQWTPLQIFINHSFNLLANVNCPNIEVLNMQIYLNDENFKSFFEIIPLIFKWNTLRSLSLNLQASDYNPIMKGKLLGLITDIPKAMRNVKTLTLIYPGMVENHIKEILDKLDIRISLKKISLTVGNRRFTRICDGRFMELQS